MKTILLDIAIILVVIILSAALFFHLGKIIEGRQEDQQERTGREIQDLTEMRIDARMGTSTTKLKWHDQNRTDTSSP
jgi:uncharacterized membrane protein